MQLVNETYDLTESFPKREQYGLIAQMRGSALSIPGNSAEGQGRDTTKEFLRFLAIARGSLRELDTYCDISEMRKYASSVALEEMRRLIEDIGKLHTALCAALRRKLGPNH